MTQHKTCFASQGHDITVSTLTSPYSAYVYKRYMQYIDTLRSWLCEETCKSELNALGMGYLRNTSIRRRGKVENGQMMNECGLNTKI